MATVETKKMSSWWWATHISPRNSVWLQENLTDMDAKVKKMIKLIEVDEDSFARRAEMYYKKRPELMNLVEEFYRAYRSLAERYDHSTGIIKHAQKTISEAFPNHTHFLDSNDGPLVPSNPSFVSKKDDQHPSESARLARFEADIKDLKEAFSKVEDDKEKGLRLSNLQSKVLLEKIDSLEIELAETNTFLVKSLFDVNVEREKLEMKIESDYEREMELTREQLEVNRTVEALRLDSKMGKDEAEIWESVACRSFAELQSSSVCELVYREKLVELTEVYQWLVDKCNLDEKNGEVQAHFDGYLPAVVAIRDAVASLERHGLCTEVNNGHSEDVTTNTTSDIVSELHDIALRIKAIDDKIKETKGLSEEQLRNEHHDNVGNHLNETLELQESGDELTLKDIMLDQASENSSSRKTITQTWYDDDQITIPPTENRYYKNDALEMPVEKELRVDSLELSNRHTEPKILERISLDIEKLKSLQKTLHDLDESGYADVKAQIKETERAILRLMGENGKIMKDIQDCESPLLNTSSLVGDHVRKWCEKVRRLEVEVEKIQFVVVKLHASNMDGLGCGKMVPLRDYLYGIGGHAHPRRKKWLCGWVKAKTSGD